MGMVTIDLGVWFCKSTIHDPIVGISVNWVI